MLPRALLATTLAALFLPSCAYMQTHKNVKELGRSYQGYQLTKPTQLFRSGSTWYLAATSAEFRLHHEAVHDNVFRKTNEPSMQLQEGAQGLAYHPISDDTATILRREDGYADNASLAKELTTTPSAWRQSLPGMTVHPIKAKIGGVDAASITYQPTPADPPFGYQLLSGVDFVLVDVPGTVVYNVAVPFVAPFVFFHEFLNDL